MACEYREADRSKLEATSSYAGATADEIYMAIGRKEPKPITYCSFCGRKL